MKPIASPPGVTIDVIDETSAGGEPVKWLHVTALMPEVAPVSPDDITITKDPNVPGRHLVTFTAAASSPVSRP